MYIYLDESGCLGFKQGSSRYFTIAFMVMKDPKYAKRVIKKIRQKYKIPISEELKGSTTAKRIKKELLTKIAKLDNIEIYSITVNKKNIQEKLKKDTNVFYNYMLGLSLIPRILKEAKNATVKVVVDKRVTSIVSGFDLDKYVKYKTLYDGKRDDIDLSIHYADSHVVHNIQVIDIITNSIFKSYNGNKEFSEIICKKIRKDRKLFF